jgi:hypothetical protein
VGGGGDLYLGSIQGFERHSNGFLTPVTEGPTPHTESSADNYCPEASTTDPSNHLAVALQAINSDTNHFDGSPQLAAYSADDHGNLTTKSTYENMPAVQVGTVNTLAMSPSGKLVAVGGKGFEIFHFNGSSPITRYSGALQTGTQFQQFSWDGENHLYALGGGKLYVYTVTPSSIKQASGSPYSIPEASSVIVQMIPAKK